MKKMIGFGTRLTGFALGAVIALAPLSTAFAYDDEDEEMEEKIETTKGVIEVDEFEDEDGTYETVSIRTDDDTLYEVDDRTAIQLSEKAGKRVQVTGTTTEDDEVMSIVVSKMKILD